MPIHGVRLMLIIDETGRALILRPSNWKEIKQALSRLSELQLRSLLLQSIVLRETIERNLGGTDVSPQTNQDPGRRGGVLAGPNTQF